MKKKKMTAKQDEHLFWIILVIPAFIIVTIFILIPIIDSIIKSFFDYKAVNIIKDIPVQWNNFQNYKLLITQGVLIKAIRVTFSYVAVVVFSQLVIGMTLALILNSMVAGSRFLRSIMMVPWIVPTVISALLWSWIFQPQYGLFKYLVNLFTFGLVTDFSMLNNANTALLGVEIAALWKQIPLMTLLLLAGLQNVPNNIIEAAKIDGANGFQRLISVVIPYMKNVIRVAVSMSIIENFKQFPLFWIMTGGGPNGATTTLAILSYKEAFVRWNLGSGAAVTTIWMFLMILVVISFNKAFTKQETN